MRSACSFLIHDRKMCRCRRAFHSVINVDLFNIYYQIRLVYILSKYGIKIWIACDSKTWYVYNLEVYAGGDWNSAIVMNTGEMLVLRITDGVNGRNVRCDNYFTSHSLTIEQKKSVNWRLWVAFEIIEENYHQSRLIWNARRLNIQSWLLAENCALPWFQMCKKKSNL